MALSMTNTGAAMLASADTGSYSISSSSSVPPWPSPFKAKRMKQAVATPSSPSAELKTRLPSAAWSLGG
eukprot:scaffold37929_cov37-Tisochrysis_lutea.AAC.1